MYSIKPITNREVWDSFVDGAAPSTFLHSFAWGEVEEDMGKRVYRLGVFDEKETLVAVALASIVIARRGNFLLCPHGPVISSEFIANEKVVSDILVAVKNEFIAIAKKEACNFVRICPILLDTPERNQIFKKLGFKEAPIHVYTELSWILDVSLSTDELLSNMKKNTRYGIRKAERDGIVIRSSKNLEDIEIFWKIYSNTAERQKFVPYSKKYIGAEFARFAETDRARWYFATYKEEVVSTAMIVFGKNSAFYHHGASLHAHSAITPSELLQWRIVEDAKSRGCRYYNFWGVVPDAKTDHPWAGLSNFKKGFGGFAENYIHAKDFSLSWKYAITYVIETIRRWKRRV